MKDIRNHRRVNDILLGPLERPALQWLAAHMPKWVTPDILTGIGLLGTFLILIGYVMSNYNPAFLWLASFGFLVNWFGDSLDGTLARHRKIERPAYGFFTDHMIDAFSQVLIFLGLGISPYISFNIACLALISFLLLTVYIYVRTSVVGEFKISFSKLGPTELRLLAILLNTYMFFAGVHTFELTIGSIYTVAISIYDVMVVVVTVILFLIYVISVIKQSYELSQLEK